MNLPILSRVQSLDDPSLQGKVINACGEARRIEWQDGLVTIGNVDSLKDRVKILDDVKEVL